MKRKTHKKPRRKNRVRAVRQEVKSRRERVPTTARQYFSRSRKFQETWNTVAHIISKMRTEHISLRKASKEMGIDQRVVVNLAGSALRKNKRGQYAARAKDKILRVLAVPTPNGIGEVALRDSRQATLLGQYWDAVQRYLQTGDASRLVNFKRKRVVSADRKRIKLITDPEQLSRLGNAGVLSFESLYARGAR